MKKEVALLRKLREDAVSQGSLVNALFFADKLVHLSGDPVDSFYLGQLYHQTGDHGRALDAIEHLTGLCAGYLKSQVYLKLERYQQVIDIQESKSDLDLLIQKTIKLEIKSLLEVSRGHAFLHQGLREQAKISYTRALEMDYKCFEAFQALRDNYMINLREEQDLLKRIVKDPDSEFVGALYSTLNAQHCKTDTLVKHHFKNNPTMHLVQAERLMNAGRYQKALLLVKSVLNKDRYHPKALYLQMALWWQTKNHSELFLLGHELVQQYPQSSLAWYCVGVYYLTIKKHVDARQYFSKATIMDGNNQYAWMGFAHSFALEDEHDQAQSAYSTCQRMMPSSYLPRLFIAMEHMKLLHCQLAIEFLEASLVLSREDPLVFNEYGTVFYQLEKYHEAMEHFNCGLQLLEPQDTHVRPTILLNLAQCHRRLG
ncbi:hypothetical protein EDD86DRAFT_68343 [Gorgonomyces haynaldii]|nr:hypothetical protein EDD86DRAFT_68343 [Gorgonomyces haynaldii]